MVLLGGNVKMNSRINLLCHLINYSVRKVFSYRKFESAIKSNLNQLLMYILRGFSVFRFLSLIVGVGHCCMIV